MGILLITLAILIIPIGSAAIANGYLRERFGKTTAFAALLAGIVLSGCLFMPIFFWLLEATTTTESDADATSPPGIMSDIGLPAEQVSDFCYQTSSRSVSPRADFEISEEDFLAWMKSQEWQPREFHSNEAGDITLVDTKLVENGSMSHNSKVFPLRSEHGHIVRHGYVLIQDRQNQGETYIYDLDSGRVYFVHWTM